ncbi:MAG TPA: aldo/keto reductase [Geminicoccaceae bacterium]
MNKRRFGRTGLQISEMVLGAGRVGGLIITADDATRRRALRMCLDAGVNWIDTAPSYGDGASEEALGWLLGELDDAERPHVSTKVRLDPAKLDNIPGEVEASMAASLKRLQRGKVDLVQLHNPIDRTQDGHTLGIDQVLGERGAIEALEALRSTGITDHVGITALGDVDVVKEVLASGRIDTAQVYYNLLNPSAGRPVAAGWSTQNFAGLLETCATHDVGVMNIRVLAAGVLATTKRHGREGMITRDTDLAGEERRASAALRTLGGAHGTGAQTAIRFALAEPRIHGVVVGVEQLAHVEEALKAFEMGPLPEAALADLETLYVTDFDQNV